MTKQLNRLTRLWPYALIATVALLCHGLLLFNDGTYWDEWLLGNYLAEGNWEEVYGWAAEAGLPDIAYFYWALKWLGILAYYKPIALFLWVSSAVLVYELCRQSRVFHPVEAVGVALLSLVYPAYQTSIELSTFRYLFFYCLFLFAMLQLWRTALSTSTVLLTPLRRAILLAVFFFTFSLNSLLVYYFPLLFVYFWQIKEQNSLSWLETAKTQLLRKLDFVALPFVYFTIKKIFFPAHGAYTGYNELNLKAGSVAAHLGNYVRNALYGQFDMSLTGLFAHPLLLMFLLPITYLAYTRAQRAMSESFGAQAQIKEVSLLALLLFVAVLLLSGMFPYAAVGLSPTISGWNTRHALLAAFPVALLVVLSLRPLWIEIPVDSPSRLDGRFIALFVGAILVVAFSLTTVSYYVAWQARAVKDKAIIADLAEVPVLKNFSVFWINDQYPLGGERLYRFYEWAGMFKKIWGGESRIGFQVQGYNQAALVAYRNYFNKSNNLSEFDPKGCQAGLIIRPGVLQYSEQQLVWKYFQTKFFEPDKLKEFLHGVLQIHVELPEVEDQRCPTRPYLDIKK